MFKNVTRRRGAGRVLLVAAAAVPVLLAGVQAAQASWVVQTAPLPAGATGGDFGNESCVSATNCTAVGNASIGSTSQDSFAEGWNGTSWTLETVPHPQDTGLAGVSCPTARGCIAVGATFTGSARTPTPLAERWNGTRWTTLTTPLPAGYTEASLASVSCPSAASCVAVGDGPYSETWNGRTWTAETIPAPAGFAPFEPTSVSCSAATSCSAVGSSGDLPAAASWNGTTWTSQTLPVPAGGTFPNLNSVSCGTASTCLAVGSYHPDATTIQPLAEQWNGTTWTIASVPPLPLRQNSFQGVSCFHASPCVAVGDQATSQPLAERWNGHSWTVQSTVLPPMVRKGVLSTVSCTSSTDCMAGGYDYAKSGALMILAEQDS